MTRFLRETDLCGGMSDLELTAFCSFLLRVATAKGKPLFLKGDPGDRMFIVHRGQVASSILLPDGTRRELGRYGPGRFFGEMAIVEGDKRSADCVALEDSELYALEAIDFYRLVWDHPMIGVKLLNAMSAVMTGWLSENSAFLTEIARWGETARRRSVTDEISGLFNRRFLLESLEGILGRGSESSRRCALLCLDLDRFHEVNASFGQQAGDAVIANVGACLSRCMGKADIASRLSGDEFAILLPGAGKAEALAMAERLRGEVEGLYISFRSAQAEHRLGLTTSVGLATCPEDACSSEPLMAAADEALLKAKWGGRNRVEAAG